MLRRPSGSKLSSRFAIADFVEDLIGNDDDTVREQTLQVVEALLTKGMLAGESPYHPGGYETWAD